jgi:ribonuclease HI
MPWVQALLRGNRVLARVRQDGSFDVQGGRVEIRYKAGDGKAYFASAGNLAREVGDAGAVLPDAHCAEAQPVSPNQKKAAPGSDTGAATGTAKKAKTAGDKTRNVPAAPRAGEWVAYGDGACSGNPGPAGLGVVVIAPDGKIREGFEFLGVGTNNIAELTAVLRALEATPVDAKGLLVHTDSQYAIGVLQKGWKAKANQELVAKVKEALAARPGVRLSYVPGHAGVPMNERADELAREAIRTGQSRVITW